MTSAPTTPPSAPAPGPFRDGTLRPWAVLIFVFFLLTSAVGSSLALESSYLLVTLASHIGLALVTLAIAGYAASTLGRTYAPFPRVLSGLSALSALGATVSGTIFLLDGEPVAPLYSMEGFAALGILCSLLLIVFGGASGKRAPVAPTSTP